MRLAVAGCGGQGPVRTKNDDCFLLGMMVERSAPLALEFDPAAEFFQRYGLLAAVADGLGSYPGGDYASRLTLDVLQAVFHSGDRRGYTAEQFAADVRGCLDQTVQTVQAALQARPELRLAGTTLAGVALLPPDHLLIFHAGDSRVLRDCAGYLRAMTVDHSVVGADVAAGRMAPEDAAATPGGQALVRSIGAEGGPVELSRSLQWAAGERFLLGTDGWHGDGRGLPESELARLLAEPRRAAELAQTMIDESFRQDGRDNATVVVVEISGEQTDG